MADTSVKLPETQAPAVDYKVKFDGKEVDLGSLENLKAQAQKVMMIERAQRNVAEQRAKLDEERTAMATQLKTAEEIARLRRFNPKAYAAMDGLFKGEIDPERVLALQHDSGDAGNTNPATANHSSREIDELRSKLSEVEKALNQTRGAVYQRSLDEQIEAAIEAHPELKTPKARELAKAQIAAAVGTGGIDPSVAAAIVATDLRAVLDEKAQADRDRLASQQSLGTINPSIGHPAFPMPPPVEFKPGMSLKQKSAQARQGMLDAIKKAGMAAASGPRPS